MDLSRYDRVVIFFSGGKDSTGAYLMLRETGYPNEQIELWHHDVDGRWAPGLSLPRPFMDWAVTPAYCDAFAQAFGLSLYHSWRDGGFEAEMLRDNAPPPASFFETPEGLVRFDGRASSLVTRLRFPQVGSIQAGRWCSSRLKIQLGEMAINQQERFKGIRTVSPTLTIFNQAGQAATWGRLQ